MSIDIEKLKELDSHWSEFLKLAGKYGFLMHAYGTTALISTHETQLLALGEEKYLSNQKQMLNGNMEDDKNA